MNFTSKQPYEAYAINFDFTPILGVETIASVAIIAVDQDSLVDVSATLLDVIKQSNTDKIVSGWVQNGTTGHNYIITCRIVGSEGSQYELDGILPVAEIPPDVGTSNGVALSSLLAAIKEIIQDPAYTDLLLTGRINDAVSAIAAGIRMPNGEISPPLPDLYKYAVVNTSTTLPYVSLPADYQRKVVKIYDSTSYLISSIPGGDYYSFSKFLGRLNKLDMTETGSVYQVCIKGTKLYYQGIPSVTFPLGIHYYRKPVAMAGDADCPDGIPEHLQMRLIKHYCCKEIFGEAIEDGQDNTGIGTKYHSMKFIEAMTDLCDFVGIDAEPQYYGEGGSEDRGVCD